MCLKRKKVKRKKERKAKASTKTYAGFPTLSRGDVKKIAVTAERAKSITLVRLLGLHRSKDKIEETKK
jgi:hypothetical protein